MSHVPASGHQHAVGQLHLLLTRDRLQSAGCPSCWLLDPDAPAVTVLDLEDGRTPSAAPSSATRLEVVRPFPVRLVPSPARRTAGGEGRAARRR